ncbi:VanZ family protein [Nitriliruptoraceae bacterium ZYF776]|nr:VanZ family protein [Profundirhabdus halotolerans]
MSAPAPRGGASRATSGASGSARPRLLVTIARSRVAVPGRRGVRSAERTGPGVERVEPCLQPCEVHVHRGLGQTPADLGAIVPHDPVPPRTVHGRASPHDPDRSCPSHLGTPPTPHLRSVPTPRRSATGSYAAPMPSRPRPRATAPTLALVAAIVLVVGMTLTTDPPWLYLRIAELVHPHVSAMTVARALNVVLFVPIGAALAVWRRPWWLLGAVAGSVTVELLQHLLPRRNPDPWDVVTNAAGAVLGYLAVLAWRRLTGPRPDADEVTPGRPDGPRGR